ncbi:conserved hypothetical protein [Culex quinquefasciatus]|uniref:Cytochrome P450 n=1 Tax=Culex quinquefasciatus TaxID=7176 RepID=B0WZC2_CULQU|nr:conserved hypothetical protein [Culex quinquefasciatus]|eukprot:XP_001862744.1 conserved hypothetical protein [Culex quinquefasciatus]
MQHISEVLQELCDAFPKHGFFGYFDFWCPVYMVKDVELVKKICIKDFNHFVNHRTQFSAEHDPLFANSLFSMNDSRWRNMRSVLSPAFTGMLQELCDAFPKHGFFGYFDFWCPVYMVKDVELVKKICIKDFNHFVNHRTQFSAEHDPLFANSLFSMNDSRWRNMRSVLSPAFTGTWNDDDLAAQCTIFLFAGFETVATLTSFMAHELAINSTVQAKLRAEVDATRAKLNGRRLTYEIIQEMTYLDMVVTETLRKWPPVPFLDRRCTKPYLLEDLDGSSVQLQPGDSIWIPTTAIMRNPKYFPQPEKFDPERFSVENRESSPELLFQRCDASECTCNAAIVITLEIKDLMDPFSAGAATRVPRTKSPSFHTLKPLIG